LFFWYLPTGLPKPDSSTASLASFSLASEPARAMASQMRSIFA
jgi:hypothetical protein